MRLLVLDLRETSLGLKGAGQGWQVLRLQHSPRAFPPARQPGCQQAPHLNGSSREGWQPVTRAQSLTTPPVPGQAQADTCTQGLPGRTLAGGLSEPTNSPLPPPDHQELAGLSLHSQRMELSSRSTRPGLQETPWPRDQQWRVFLNYTVPAAPWHSQAAATRWEGPETSWRSAVREPGLAHGQEMGSRQPSLRASEPEAEQGPPGLALPAGGQAATSALVASLDPQAAAGTRGSGGVWAKR